MAKAMRSIKQGTREVDKKERTLESPGGPVSILLRALMMHKLWASNSTVPDSEDSDRGQKKRLCVHQVHK